MSEGNVAISVAALLREVRAAHAQLDGLDAECLLAYELGRSRAWLYAHGDASMAVASVERVRALCRRRAAGEPYAYLIGEREFYGRRFVVSPAVLIPRGDSECLLETALSLHEGAGLVIDAGTGSGALAVSFSLERAAATVLAIENSERAVKLAQANARALGAPVQFVRANWLAALANGSVDLIMSNPPYLAEDDEHLDGLGLQYEPREALVSGETGLEDMVSLAHQARSVLKTGGYLLLEHGASQGAAAREVLRSAGFTAVETRLDLESRERVSLGYSCR